MKRYPSLLIAFGGNALIPRDRAHPHQKEEFLIARRSMEKVADLVEQGYDRIILTHGNGPQVGRIFLQQELTRDEFPRQVTLDVCVADSQGRIGYILQNVFDSILSERSLATRAFTIITQVVVDPADPAFNKPDKPIGVFYDKEEAKRLTTERGWTLKEDAGRGFRRVVPSPRPLMIVEKQIFHDILDLGFIAIGAGGGGIPVRRTTWGRLEGIEAVIDKDRTSALLASEIGIDTFVILTTVKGAFLNYQSKQPHLIRRASVTEMQGWLNDGHFLEGSMRPKVEAAVDFLARGGQRAVIAHLDELDDAVEENSGTQIYPG
ncbi:MAG: carbamate kinase [Nitrospinaceae bacterium]|nr:MAG: carbamate kinase [Nitrospinaceae bacterium]